MKKILLMILTILFSLNAQALFEVKDASDNTVFSISDDGLRVFNLGDTLMVISSTEIKAFIANSKDRALSRSFSVTTSTTGKGTGDVINIDSDGMRVYSDNDKLMDITGSNITAYIDSNSTKALSRSFSVTTSTTGKESVDVLEVSTGATKLREGSGGDRYTDFSPENIFLGLKAGEVTTGVNNVFVGNQAGLTNGLGDHNVFIGTDAGHSNTSNDQSTYVGSFAGYSSTGSANTFVGALSGRNNGSGNYNSFFGDNSGYENGSGYYNCLFGAASGAGNSGGIGNTVMGYHAGVGSSSSYSYNSLYGKEAGKSLTGGSNNVMIGNESGETNQTGSGNVFLGNQSGYSETGSNKLYIANSNTSIPLVKGTFPNVDLDLTATNINLNGTLNGNLNSSTTGLNYFRISSLSSTSDSGIELFREGTGFFDWRINNTGGNLRFGVSGDDFTTITDQFRINYATGNVGIGSISPSQKLDIFGGNGRVESGYSWLTSSDIRYKTNITTLGNALDNVKKMRGVRYDLKEDKDTVPNEGKHIGFIAQELEKIYDELVVDDDKGYKSVAYDKVTAVLVEAVKEQQKMIEELKKEVQDLKKSR